MCETSWIYIEKEKVEDQIIRTAGLPSPKPRNDWFSGSCNKIVLRRTWSVMNRPRYAAIRPRGEWGREIEIFWIRLSGDRIYRVLHKNLQLRITEHLFVPAKHPSKAAEMWHATVMPPQIDQQLRKRIVNWRYRSRGSQPWDDAAKRGEGKWGTSNRDGSHFGSFDRMFGRDKQIFWDSRLQVFMQNSVNVLNPSSASNQNNRKRVNEDVLTAEVVSTKEEATLTILTLMKQYDFSIGVLMDRLTGGSNPTTFDW